VVIFADVSNNKRQELLRLDHAIATERTRIAGNIHDNVSQSVNATILEIRAASKGLSQSVKVASTHLRKTLELALNSLAEARRATSVLSDDFDISQGPGLVLRGLASQLFYGSTVQLAFDLQQSVPPLPPHLTRELIRSGKEALRNACKHANASRVLTSFFCDASNAVLKIADDGIGFVVSSYTTPKGFGLLSMHARTERLRGTLDISSSPGQGTAITLTLPVFTSLRAGE
jgi:signal transduction histidine kinase